MCRKSRRGDARFCMQFLRRATRWDGSNLETCDWVSGAGAPAHKSQTSTGPKEKILEQGSLLGEADKTDLTHKTTKDRRRHSGRCCRLESRRQQRSAAMPCPGR